MRLTPDHRPPPAVAPERSRRHSLPHPPNGNPRRLPGALPGCCLGLLLLVALLAACRRQLTPDPARASRIPRVGSTATVDSPLTTPPTTDPTAPPTTNLSSDLPLILAFTNTAAWTREPTLGPSLVLRSPPLEVSTPWNEAIVSWNVQPAARAALTVEARGFVEDRPTRFYGLGHWSLDPEAGVARTSLDRQRDLDGQVLTDTLRLDRSSHRIQIRLTLHGQLVPHPERLRLVTVSLANTETNPTPRPARTDVWGRFLEVPERSQVAYADGRAWCSPTSVSMILGWWARSLGRPELDQDVPAVAEGVHDPAWPGTGNWPFNTAYAGSFPGMLACAARLRDLRDLEDLVAEGVPVVLSVNAPALRGKPPARDGGHLVLCLGFTPEGDVVANDPWARLEQGQRVRRVYPRAYVDRAWEHAHRLAYLIIPEHLRHSLPARWE